MKKVYLLAGALVGSFGLSAQVSTTQSPLVEKSSTFKARSVVNHSSIEQMQTRAEGDSIWGNDFETASEWMHVDGPSHTDGDWEIVSAVPAGIVSQEPTYGFPTEMNSPTGDVNGGSFAFVNSDAAGAAGVQEATFELVNAIDLSAVSNTALTLEWYQIFRHFQETNFIGISNDGGTTWTDFQVNDVGVNVNSNDIGVLRQVLSLPVPTGGWSNNVKIRFQYFGQFDWFWGVDDVKLFETYGNDLATNFFRPIGGIGLDYTQLPTSQSSFPGYAGFAAFTNLGANDQPNAALKMEVAGQSYSEVGTTISLDAQAVDTAFVDGTLFDIVSAGEGTYTITGSPDLGGAVDAVPSNDEITKETSYGGLVYARDDESLSGVISGLAGSLQGLPLTIGNRMETFDPLSIGMIEMYVDGATDNAPYIGQEIFGAIYQINTDGTTALLGNTEVHVLEASDMDSWVTIRMEDGNLLELPAGVDFILTVNNSGGTDAIRFGMAQPLEQGTVLGIDPTNGSLYNLTTPDAIKIRIVESSVGVEEAAANFNLNVYPNPATTNVNVDFEIQNQTAVSVNVTDLSGKVVYTEDLGNLNAGKHSANLSTDAMSSGVYFYNFVAGEQVITKKLVVKK